MWKQWEILVEEEAILVPAITFVNTPSKNVQKFRNQQLLQQEYTLAKLGFLGDLQT